MEREKLEQLVRDWRWNAHHYNDETKVVLAQCIRELESVLKEIPKECPYCVVPMM